MKKIFIILVICTSSFWVACQKETISQVTQQIDPEEDLVCESSNFNPYHASGGYIANGLNGKQGEDYDVDYKTYSFRAPNGDDTITGYKFQVIVSDGSKPVLSIRSEDTYYGGTIIKPGKNIPVVNSYVIFTNMTDFIGQHSNWDDRVFSFETIYSKIGQNGVVSGKTRCSITLVSVTYKTKGLVKTIYPNLKSKDRMLVNSHLGPYGRSNGPMNHKLKLGNTWCFQQQFYSQAGDNLLQEVPLKFLGSGYNIGALPKMYVSVYEHGLPAPVMAQAQVTSVGNNTFVVKLPQSYLNKKSRIVTVDFYIDVLAMSSSASLNVGLGNLKYCKWTEVKSGTEFSVLNEYFQWEQMISPPSYEYTDNGYFWWKLRP